MALQLQQSLPKPWSFALTQDGRIFFINDELRVTTWLHPVTNLPLATGHQRVGDLPAGWERGVSDECVPYFIDHNKQETTLIHPITKETVVQTEVVHQQPQPIPQPSDSVDPGSPANMSTESRKTPKKKSPAVSPRPPIIKRSVQAPVTMQGWLWKQGSDGFMRWKKRWFVLADFCLFYYNGPEEEKVLGSILLPSYEISPFSSDSKATRKYQFKLEMLLQPNRNALEHQNMRTYFLAADTKELFQQWMNALALATLLQREMNREERHESILRPDGQYGQSGTEDEDSGFTSYHSRRYVGSPSQDGNSPLNGSFSSDCARMRPEDIYREGAVPHPHNDRSGGDIYLGNSEKYPNSYGSGHPHHYRNVMPQNGVHQQMYAPPKPKRLANPDNYGRIGMYGPQSAPQYDGRTGQLIENPNFRDGYPGVNVQEMAPLTRGKREDYRSVPQLHNQDWGPQINYGYTGGDYRPVRPMNPGNLPGNPSGNHGANPTGNPTGNQTGNPTGNSVGNPSGNPAGNVSGNSGNSHFENHNPGSPRQQRILYRDQYDPAVLREKGHKIFHAQRPHSANFLEHDGTYEQEQDHLAAREAAVMRSQRGKGSRANAVARPKSSIEQYSPQDYWDEIPVNGNSHPHQPPHTPHTPHPQMWEMPPPQGQDNSFYSYASSQEGANQSQQSESDGDRPPRNSSEYEKTFPVIRENQYQQRLASQLHPANDPHFMRSASARLPSTAQQHQVGPMPAYSQDDGLADDSKHLQQREESMQRLLEWKQRMLQSPLTKKYPQQQKTNSKMPSTPPKKTGDYRKMGPQELSEQDIYSQSMRKPRSSEMQGSDDKFARMQSQSPMRGDDIHLQEMRRNSQPIGRAEAEAKLMSQRATMARMLDNKPISATLQRYRNSYSSDDEESGSGSLKGLYFSRTQPRRKPKNDLLREDPNMSDSELQMRGKSQNLKMQKYTNPSDSLGGNSVRLSISAGDLLGKTHEELILLLIQLRRTQARLQKAMDTCRIELEGEKKLMQIDTKNRKIHCKKVEELTQQLEECSKQFELTKPLVNLVDNMVKLGSLYGGSEQALSTQYQLDNLPHPDLYSPPKKMIEFTRRLQEQRLLDEERFEWEQLVPDQVDLQDKLQKLYQLDRSLQEESIVLSNLQQDKDMLERALVGLQAKATATRDNAVEQERYHRQQRVIETELTKVQMQLVNTTKKLEETAAENARIEHEILLLRQKIQQTLKKATNVVPNIAPDDMETAQLKVQLEEELAHVQSIMDELAKRRKDISGAVEKIKEGNKHEVRPSPTGVSGSAPLPGRKLHRSTYLETDLDTMETHDVLDDIIEATVIPERMTQLIPKSVIPLYVNTDSLNDKLNDSTSSETYGNDEQDVMDGQDYYTCQDISEADDKMKRFYGIIPREKPAEIKTVRIVKRESERRNKVKDRKKVSYEEQPLTRVIEEPDSILFDDFDYLDDVQMTEFQRSMSLPRNYGRAVYIPALVQPSGVPIRPPNSLPLTTATATTVSTTTITTTTKILPNVPYYYRTPTLSAPDRPPTARERLFGNTTPLSSSLESPPRSPLTTPEFKSEAARQIVAETAQHFLSSLAIDPDLQLALEGAPGDMGSLKRRYKRRHYTISSSQPLVLEAAPSKLVHARSRDDLDMERCLRTANTPDVVKSTIRKTENFDESTIDRELSLPQKIVIPERYIEQDEEELTAEEKLHRIQKAESIKKMLSESTTYGDLSENEIANASETLKKKFEQEKKQREQLLTLNQRLAQEVKERSKAVAAKAMQNPPEQLTNIREEEDDDGDLSPVRPLPTIQQRENYLT